MADLTDAELLAELGISAESKKQAGRTPEEARVIAGYPALCCLKRQNLLVSGSAVPHFSFLWQHPVHGTRP